MSVQEGRPRSSSENGPTGPPEELTGAAKRFFEARNEMHRFVAIVIDLAKGIDGVSKFLTEALHSATDDPEEKTRLSKELEDIRHNRRKGAYAGVRRYRRLIAELVATRVVDNYLTYVAELLALIFTTRPETLKSNESMRVEDVLKHSSMQEVIAEIAERRVLDLSRQDMEDLAKYVEERLGFRLFNDSDNLKRVVRIVKARNLIVHNRGIVNRVYKARVPEDPTPLGERLEVGGEVTKNSEFLAQSVVDLDARAIQKFGLPFEKWDLPPENVTIP